MGAQESVPALTEKEEEAQRARNIKRMDSRMRQKLQNGEWDHHLMIGM